MFRNNEEGSLFNGLYKNFKSDQMSLKNLLFGIKHIVATLEAFLNHEITYSIFLRKCSSKNTRIPKSSTF